MEDFFNKLQAIVGISKYSNSEVITPLNIVKDMVDLLPADVFNPDAKFLDPAVKSGRFLAEIYRRLMDSPLLAHMDEQSRRQHILENQLYGLATSATAATIVRKQLYDDPTIAGNVVYTEGKVTKELIQGAFSIMKFDVVIGNPPYNNDIYLDFVTIGHSLASKYTCMITPAKWQAKGGDKNEKFRKDIVPYIRKIVYYPDCSDVFEIADMGGISYYLLGNNTSDQIEVEEKCRLNKLLNRTETWKNWNGIRVLDLEANTIIEKVLSLKEPNYSIKKTDMSKKYQIFVAIIPAIGGSKGQGTYIFSKDGCLQYLAKPSVANGIETQIFSSNYRVIYASDNLDNIKSAISYFYSRLVRFLLYSARCGNSSMIDEGWRFVPDPGAFDHIFTDQELYQKYGLTPDEIAIIESVIKERK